MERAERTCISEATETKEPEFVKRANPKDLILWQKKIQRTRICQTRKTEGLEFVTQENPNDPNLSNEKNQRTWICETKKKKKKRTRICVKRKTEGRDIEPRNWKDFVKRKRQRTYLLRHVTVALKRWWMDGMRLLFGFSMSLCNYTTKRVIARVDFTTCKMKFAFFLYLLWLKLQESRCRSSKESCRAINNQTSTLSRLRSKSPMEMVLNSGSPARFKRHGPCLWSSWNWSLLLKSVVQGENRTDKGCREIDTRKMPNPSMRSYRGW